MTAPPLQRQASRRRCRVAYQASGWIVSAVLVSVLVSSGHAAPVGDITGVWLTQEGEGAIEIQPCGEQRCGRIAWMKDLTDEHGQIPIDRNNPEPALRARRICGLQIISGLTPQADGSWGQGRVYDPSSGRTYDMEIRRATPDTIKATGYLGLKLLGQTREWRRAPKNLGRCYEAVKR